MVRSVLYSGRTKHENDVCESMVDDVVSFRTGLSTRITRIRSTAVRRFEGNYVAGRLSIFLRRYYLSGDAERGTYRKRNDLEEAGFGEANLLSLSGSCVRWPGWWRKNDLPRSESLDGNRQCKSGCMGNLAYVLALCLKL